MKLNYPVSKSHMAFLFAVEEMFEHWPKSVYMWTFTFKDYQPDWRAMARWKEFSTWLCGDGQGSGEYPLIKGLRVVEVHPGNNFHGLSHGLHFHCLLNQRVNIHRVLRKCRKWDFGRVHVRKVTQEEAVYVGKYLTKGQPELLKGARRWGTINWPHACKVRNVKVESEFHRNIERVQKATKTCQLTADVVHSIFVNTRIHGAYKNWPIDRYYYSMRSEEVLGPRGCTLRQSQGHCDPGLSPLKLLRSNKRTREQSMLRQAIIWKERARRRAIGFEACLMEDWQKREQARKEQAAGGEKFLSPWGAPGDSPVKEQDGTLSYYVDQWDKKVPKTVGM